MKCVICKAINTRREACIHPNQETYKNFRNQLWKLKTRDSDAIKSICDEHRKSALEFNTVVIDLFNSVQLVAELCEKRIPLSALPKESRAGIEL